MTFWFRTLDNHFKENLISKNISLESLEEIHNKLLEEHKKKKKILIILSIAVTFSMFFVSYSIYITNGHIDLFKWMLCFLLVICFIIFIITYFCCIGLFQIQYNKVIKDNYPDLYDKLKL